MTAVMCKHKRQLTVCAECAPEAERNVWQTGGDTKFRLGLIKRSNDEPIPEDEPFFVLRARDYLAVPLLCEYFTLCAKDNCNNYQMAGADALLRRFEHFAAQHPERMKQPGVTRGQ